MKMKEILRPYWILATTGFSARKLSQGVSVVLEEREITTYVNTLRRTLKGSGTMSSKKTAISAMSRANT